MDSELIQSDPAVLMGKPVVTGTRITVELILEKLSAEETIDQILEAHPRLTRIGNSQLAWSNLNDESQVLR